jgi:hypothetical protein
MSGRAFYHERYGFTEKTPEQLSGASCVHCGRGEVFMVEVYRNVNSGLCLCLCVDCEVEARVYRQKGDGWAWHAFGELS